jgi:hypothetical protein
MNLGPSPSRPRARRRDAGRAIAGALTALALFTAIPALLGVERQAAAQQPAADSVKQLARQRYNEGVAAYDAGRFEDARAAFQQAYALTRHPAVLLNLGQSELRSNHPEDAGNHLQQFLREHTAARADERAAAEKGIAEAKKKASLVVVSVDAAGADVSIDGVTVGKSPIYDPIFIKPGKHTVFATTQGRSAAVAVEAKVGMASQATLTLGTPGLAPPPVPVPGPTPPVPPGPPAAVPTPSVEPVAPPPSVTPPPDGVAERESFGSWYKRKPLAWVGTGLAGAGLVMGIVGGAASLQAASAGNNVADQIRQHWKDTNPSSPMPAVCGDQSTGAGVYPGYETACKTLSDNVNLHRTDVAVAVTGWVLFGVGVAGTTLYTLIDWYPNRGPGKSASSAPPIAVVPAISPTFKGVGVMGAF